MLVIGLEGVALTLGGIEEGDLEDIFHCDDEEINVSNIFINCPLGTELQKYSFRHIMLNLKLYF